MEHGLSKRGQPVSKAKDKLTLLRPFMDMVIEPNLCLLLQHYLIGDHSLPPTPDLKARGWLFVHPTRSLSCLLPCSLEDQASSWSLYSGLLSHVPFSDYPLLVAVSHTLGLLISTLVWDNFFPLKFAFFPTVEYFAFSL